MIVATNKEGKINKDLIRSLKNIVRHNKYPMARMPAVAKLIKIAENALLKIDKENGSSEMRNWINENQ